jgi:hypothetical protein
MAGERGRGFGAMQMPQQHRTMQQMQVGSKEPCSRSCGSSSSMQSHVCKQGLFYTPDVCTPVFSAVLSCAVLCCVQAGVECDMCVERACVALLLGSPNQSLQELGLSAQGRHDDVRNPTQQAAREYVLVSTWAGVGWGDMVCFVMVLPAMTLGTPSLHAPTSWPCQPTVQLQHSVTIMSNLASVCEL